ncbi:unnamed protein product [Phaeothamnion confervicola]
MASAPWTEQRRVLEIRRRWHVADVTVRVLEGFREHRSGRNAAVIAYYGFLSIFPLMLALTTILGFVLEGHPALRQDIIDSAVSRIPIIGQQIADDPSKLKGSLVALVVGLLTTLWAGMRAFVGVQSALDDVAEVPLDGRPNVAKKRLHALEGIAIVGVAQIGTAILHSLVGVDSVNLFEGALLIVAAAVINVLVLALIYRWLCSRPLSLHATWPGALLAGALFTVLQLIGVRLVGRAVANASPVYGTFASVIALLSWLSLHANVTLLGAELNRVVDRD